MNDPCNIYIYVKDLFFQTAVEFKILINFGENTEYL